MQEKKIYRIRRSVPGSSDEFIVCDTDGHPMEPLFDRHDLRTFKKYHPNDDIIEEFKEFPVLKGYKGETALERLTFALRKYKNENRLPENFGYVRVSTLDQAGDENSLEDQETTLIRAHVLPENIYKDVYTGSTIKCPKLTELIEMLKPGDTLIVTKLDRIARSVTEGAKLIEGLINKGVKIKILAMGESTQLDKSPMGKQYMHILLSFAEFEQETTRSRMTEGKEIARQKDGYREGRPPKFSQEQRIHAMQLLESDYSYTQVSKMTGMSISTLERERRKQKSHN